MHSRRAGLLAWALFLSPAVLHAGQLSYAGETLDLLDSKRACYLRFIDLFEADYFRSADGSARCLQLRYLRKFDAEALHDATVGALRRLQGDQVVWTFSEQLFRLGSSYQPVAPGDRYSLCIDSQGRGELLRDGRTAVRFDERRFAEAMLGIWVEGESQGLPVWRLPGCFGDNDGESASADSIWNG